MKATSIFKWVGFVFLLLLVSALSGIIAVQVTDLQRQRATATQQAFLVQVQQTQTADAYLVQLDLEKQIADFGENIILTAKMEDCIAGDLCNNWARKVLVVTVMNENKKNMDVEWPPADLSCQQASANEIPSNGGSEVFRCNALQRTSIDSVDYVRNVCMMFTASIINVNDAKAGICVNTENIP